MDRSVIETKIIKKKEIAAGIFELELDANNDLKKAKAGQFISVSCGNGTYLRRPISICEIKESSLRIIFQVRGKGTKALSEFKEGDVLSIMGPLGGTGFATKGEYKNAVVIGGGIGIYPLLQVAKETNATAILGFRNKDFVTLETDFKKVSKNVFITTDDGSYERKGLVTEILLELIEKEEIDAIFACGPLPMLRAIKKIAEEKDIFAQVSMEERMGCGIGACLCCATPVKDEELEDGFTYAHVCSHGPVFDAREVML